MVHNTEKLELATYYRERGFSYSEIAKIVGVSKATLSNWFADAEFSKRVTQDNVKKAAQHNQKRIQLLNKAKQSERTKQYREVARTAAVEYKNYRSQPLFIAGVMLYAAQGDTDSAQIRLSTTDMISQRIFVNFAARYLGVERKQVHFWLLLYPDHDVDACVNAWAKTLRLSPAQFYKTQVIQSRSGKETLHFGVGNTIISSALLRKKLDTWIELANKELTKA